MSLKDYIHSKPELETESLILRSLNEGDIDALLEWTPNKDMYKYWGKNPGKADKDPRLLFSSPPKPSKSFHWGIALKPENKIIGEIWIYLIENDRMAKLAIRVSDKYQKKGYATQALREAVRFCFEKTELQRLWADVDVRNSASVRMLEKCRFTREGMIRQGKMVSSWCDFYIYGILKTDFENCGVY